MDHIVTLFVTSHTGHGYVLKYLHRSNLSNSDIIKVSPLYTFTSVPCHVYILTCWCTVTYVLSLLHTLIYIITYCHFMYCQVYILPFLSLSIVILSYFTIHMYRGIIYTEDVGLSPVLLWLIAQIFFCLIVLAVKGKGSALQPLMSA